MLCFESVISQLHKMKDNLTEFSLDPEIYNLALAYASEQANLENKCSKSFLQYNDSVGSESSFRVDGV